MNSGSPTLTLANGVQMPQVGLGTWQSTHEEAKRAVHAAIDAGYRLFDTAVIYGNEEAIGEAIQECIEEGKIKREDVFITTKLWADHVHPQYTESELEKVLQRLKTTYVDLFLAHAPTALKPDTYDHDDSVRVEDIWCGLEGVYEKGMTKAIGVSNFTIEQIQRIMKVSKIPIHVLQIECHLYLPQHELVSFCKAHNIVVTSYATLGSNGRTNYQEVEWKPSKNALADSNVLELAEKYKKTPAQILLRYCMDRGMAIIPKSASPSRIVENFQVFDFALTEEDIQLLESTTQRQRLFMFDFSKGHPEDPFKEERS